MRTLFVPGPQIFKLWVPLSPDRGQISARYHRRPIGGDIGYKFDPMQIFHRGTLRGSAAAGKNLQVFSNDGSHVLGASTQPPLYTAFRSLTH